MKKLSLAIISLAACLTISGQQVNKSQNRFRGDDAVERKQVQAEGFDLQGKDNVWSLEGLELSKKTFSTEYTTAKDTLMGLERGHRTYYRQTDDDISIIGSENVLELVSYDMPETWLKFPIQLGDSVNGYFNGTGKYCEHLFLRRFGTYLTKADAKGWLVLPDGSTMENVLRLHTERHIGIIAAPIDTMKWEIPAFTVDSIVKRMAEDTAQIQEDVYRWYAEGYRYPVLEAKVISQGKERLSEEIFFCPLESQEQLVLDEDNKKVRARLAASNDTQDDGSGNGDGAGFAYHVSQDEGSESITVSYTAEQPAKVTVLLANSQGYVFRQASQSDGSPVSLSYSGLPRGQYIVNINAGSEQFAEKFNVK